MRKRPILNHFQRFWAADQQGDVLWTYVHPTGVPIRWITNDPQIEQNRRVRHVERWPRIDCVQDDLGLHDAQAEAE